MTEREPERKKKSLGMLKLDSFCDSLIYTNPLPLPHSRPKENRMPAARGGALVE